MKSPFSNQDPVIQRASRLLTVFFLINLTLLGGVVYELQKPLAVFAKSAYQQVVMMAQEFDRVSSLPQPTPPPIETNTVNIKTSTTIKTNTGNGTKTTESTNSYVYPTSRPLPTFKSMDQIRQENQEWFEQRKQENKQWFEEQTAQNEAESQAWFEEQTAEAKAAQDAWAEEKKAEQQQWLEEQLNQ